MRNIFICIVGTILLSSVCSCTSIRTYRNGTYGAVKSYTAIPEYYGENTSTTYVSGSFSSGENRVDANGIDKTSIIALNAHRSHSFKYFNFYYGAGGRYGSYKFRTGLLEIIKAGERESFFNIDAKAGVNFQKSWQNLDWRILGGELTYTYETGPYQDRLDELEGELSTIQIYSQPSTLTYNVNTELIWKVNRKNAIGLGFFYGSILNQHTEDSANSGHYGIMGSYRYSQFTFSIIQTGTEQVKSGSVQFGLTYRLF